MRQTLNDHRLLVRTDANSQIGTGHVMRCIALAQAWRNRGGGAVFLSSIESDGVRQRILDEGFELVSIDKSHPHAHDERQVRKLLACNRKAQPAWLVLDGYHFDPAYQSALRATGCKVLVIDDMAHQPEYHADILLNQNIHARSLNYNCGPDTLRLLGTQYVLLRKEFLRKKRAKWESFETARRILVTMGGADPENVTLTVVRALKWLKRGDLEVKIVLGAVNPNRQSIEKELRCSPFDFQILSSVTDMPFLMAWADIAVSAGGSTCWELMFVGVPFLVVILSENQEGIANGLGEAGAAMNCGWHYALRADGFAEIIVELIEDRECRMALSRKGWQMVDGLGSERVMERMRRHLE